MRLRYLGHATISVESRGVRLLTDPWLTPRLDRFWEHYPPLDETAASPRQDVILLSHHHFDHFHLPSLNLLNRDATVIYPVTRADRAVTGAGGGAFAIPWLLKLLGFRQLYPIRPFERVEVGDLSVLALPSAVDFPEYTYVLDDGETRAFLAADSMLHPDTVRWVQRTNPRFDLAVLPVHSLSNDACFRDRGEEEDMAGRRTLAVEKFRRYLAEIPADAVIPGAFGWRVIPEPVTDEPPLDWINRKLFPLTLADGYRIGTEAGARMHVWGPGDEVALKAGRPLEGGGPHWDDLDFLRQTCDTFRYDPSEPLPPFEPGKIGPPLSDAERDEVIRFVEGEMADRLAATPFYMQCVERGIRVLLRVTGAGDNRWVLDFTSGDCRVARADGAAAADRSVWVAERAFHAMMRGEAHYAHTWGQWVADVNLLDSLFNDPRSFMDYATRALSSPGGVAQYGH